MVMMEMMMKRMMRRMMMMKMITVTWSDQVTRMTVVLQCSRNDDDDNDTQVYDSDNDCR